MRTELKKFVAGISFLLFFLSGNCQHSVARQWNEMLLEAIRNDLARPTVHARNLFHISAAMYDAWSVFEVNHRTYLLGRTRNGYQSVFDEFVYASTELEELQQKAISYAAHALIIHRFKNSPGQAAIAQLADDLLIKLGYDPGFTSIDYSFGSAAALGNYIANDYINFGLLDGSNEVEDYANTFYMPVNPFLDPQQSGNAPLVDPNRWQPLAFDVFIDQSGNEIPGEVPDFLGAEWGSVYPFSLTGDQREDKQRDGAIFPVYLDPGPPPYAGDLENDQYYKEGFAMVSIWSGHLDALKEVEIDISPASIGNYTIEDLPDNWAEYDRFYQYLTGGDASLGHELNPVTGEPYPRQLVSLGDYGRILAEFWADGPDSETPPGHWFTILNQVADHPALEKKMNGQGNVLEELEWDIKSYFILGGAMHDVAVTVWGIKGYYDYIRPISAIRYMADQGQSTSEDLPNYHTDGIPLIDGYIELVSEADPLVGPDLENLHKIKLLAWKGHDYIENTETDVAGVDWILAENWWPYQRPTFVTPNFAGYVSGHSTFSRTAAEVLTLLTGDAFFPGGVGEFEARKDEFLVFEEGPTEDIILQWATYRDAADQCSLSRIWGGIHPPADDLPGRVIGETIGVQAFQYGIRHFNETITTIRGHNSVQIYPVPTRGRLHIEWSEVPAGKPDVVIYDMVGREVASFHNLESSTIDVSGLPNGRYVLKLSGDGLQAYRYLVKE